MIALARKDWPSLLGLNGRQFGELQQRLAHVEEDGSLRAVVLDLDLGDAEQGRPAVIAARGWDEVSGAQTPLYEIVLDAPLAADLNAPGDDTPVGVVSVKIGAGGEAVALDDDNRGQILRLINAVKGLNKDVVASQSQTLEGGFEPFAQRLATAGLAELVPMLNAGRAEQSIAADDPLVMPAAIAEARFGIRQDSLPYVASNQDLDDVNASYGAERVLERDADGTLRAIRYNNRTQIGLDAAVHSVMAEVRFEPAGEGKLRLTQIRVGDGEIDLADESKLRKAAGALREMAADLDADRIADALGAFARAGLSSDIGMIPPPPGLEDGGRFIYRSRGGIELNSVGPVKAEIGRNANMAIFDYEQDGAYRAESIVYDDGIGTSDRNETGYDEYYSCLREAFRDKNDPDHEPAYPAHFLFIGHPHFDHDGGPPHHVKDGLDIPLVLGNQYVIASFKAKCQALGIPRHDFPPTVELKSPDDVTAEELEAYRKLSPEERYRSAIERGYLLEGVDLPFKAGNMTFRAEPVTHSTPTTGLIVDTAAASMRLNGDYKLDEGSKIGGETSEEFLGYPVDFATAEGTSLLSPGHNPTQDEIAETARKLLDEESGRDLLVVQFSKSLPSVVTLAEAAARHPDQRTITSVGANMQQSFRWMNKFGLDSAYWPKAKNQNFKDYIQHQSFTRLLAQELREMIDNGELIEGRRQSLLDARAETSGKTLAKEIAGYRKEVEQLIDRLEQGEILPRERLDELNEAASAEGKPTFSTRRKREEEAVLRDMRLFTAKRLKELRRETTDIVGVDSNQAAKLLEGDGERGRLMAFITGVHMEKDSATDKLFNSKIDSKIDIDLTGTTVIFSQGPSIPSERERYHKVVNAFLEAGAKIRMPDEDKTGHYILEKDKEREHRKGEPLYSSGHSHEQTFKKHAALQNQVQRFVMQHGGPDQIDQGEKTLQDMGRETIRATNQTGIAKTRDGEPEIIGPFLDIVEGVKYNRKPSQYYTPTGVDDREKTRITMPLLPDSVTKLSPTMTVAAMVSRARHDESMKAQEKRLSASSRAKSAIDQFKELGGRGGPAP